MFTVNITCSKQTALMSYYKNGQLAAEEEDKIDFHVSPVEGMNWSIS